MVRTRLASLQIPSVRQELRHQKHSASKDMHAPITIEARAIPVPYPTGTSTLQIGGIHLRLVDIAEAAAMAVATRKAQTAAAAAASASHRGGSGAGFHFFGSDKAAEPEKSKKTELNAMPSKKRAAPIAETPSAEQAFQGPPLAVNVVIRVQTQPAGAAVGSAGEAADYTREFVAAVVPLQLGGNASKESTRQTSSSSPSSSSPRAGAESTSTSWPSKSEAKGSQKGESGAKVFPTPFRPAKKGPRPPKGETTSSSAAGIVAAVRPVLEEAPVSACTFVKLDLRLQVEKVRFIVEIHPGIPTVNHTQPGAASWSASLHRRRPRDGQEEDAEQSNNTLDATLEVVVVGTISSLI